MFGASMLLLSGVASFTPFGLIAGWIALSRTGIGTLMPAANTAAMRQVEPAMLAFAAPAATFLTQSGGALGVAILSVLLETRAAFHADALAPALAESNAEVGEALRALVQGFLEDGHSPAASTVAAHEQIASALWRSAQVLAFRDCFFAIALAFAALFVVIPLIPRGRTLARSPENQVEIAPAPARNG
jgi:DHA2 family multidrug resistance protein